MKIGQYLAKIWTRAYCAVFLGHPVYGWRSSKGKSRVSTTSGNPGNLLELISLLEISWNLGKSSGI